MNDLNQLIDTISKDDQQRFINYLAKKNKRKDAKNIQLFKLLNQGYSDTEVICNLLYDTTNRVAYHALRKRLYQSAIDFIANQNIENENTIEMQTIKYIIVSRNLFAQDQHHIAYKVLNKAELIAQENFAFTLLNEIYHTQIQYAYTNPLVDLNKVIQKFEKNQHHYLTEERLNIAYAKIRSVIHDIRFNSKVINLPEFILKTLDQYQLTTDDSLSFKSLYQLITITNLSALTIKDYYNIESFLLNIYEKIKHHKHKDRQLYYHIHVVYQIANMFFRNKKFKQAFLYLDTMSTLMLHQNKKFYKQYLIKHQNLLALSHCYTGNINQAISITDNYLNTKHKDTEALLDLHLSLCMYYFLTDDFSKAIKIINSFYHSDQWYEQKAGKEWVMKKSLIEILLHIELANIDLVSSRILSFKRKYYPYLKTLGENRVITFLNLVEQTFNNPELITTDQFREKINTSFEFKSSIQEDIFVMSFYSWLKAKINKKSLYDTILNMIPK